MGQALAFGLLLLLPLWAWGQPAITAVSGTLSDGSALTITGSSFGANGPTLGVYDEFEGCTGEGNDVPLSATVSAWTEYGTNRATCDTNAHSGSWSMRGHNSAANGWQRVRLLFSDSTEMLLSYWTRIPDGTTFPGDSTPGEFPAGSTYKPFWMTDGGNTSDNDVVLCTHTAPNCGIGGNDTTSITTANRSTVYSFDYWMRHLYYMDAPATPTDNGTTVWQVLWEGIGLQVNTTITDKPVFTGSNTPHHWSEIEVLAWTGNHEDGDWSKTRPVFDDVYFAYGDNARARVEIADHATYASATRLQLMTPTAWADTSITATLRQGAFPDFNAAYVFVTDASGNRNATGYFLGGVGGGGELRSHGRGY